MRTPLDLLHVKPPLRVRLILVYSMSSEMSLQKNLRLFVCAMAAFLMSIDVAIAEPSTSAAVANSPEVAPSPTPRPDQNRPMVAPVKRVAPAMPENKFKSAAPALASRAATSTARKAGVSQQAEAPANKTASKSKLKKKR
jgi:hypothetical protein